MNMFSIKRIILLALLVTGLKSLSQSNFQTLSESNVALNHQVSKKYQVNFSLKSRSFIYHNDDLGLKQQQIDLVHFSSLKLNHYHTISLGLQYRNRDVFNMTGNELRMTQQFNMAKRQLAIRFGHRFRTEQRILKTKTIFRQRYRFAIDFPLNGERLDIGEAYFVGSVETLLSLSKIESPEIDQRATFLVGWQLSDTLKLQTGLEYRAEAFNVSTENKLFILTSAVLKI